MHTHTYTHRPIHIDTHRYTHMQMHTDLYTYIDTHTDMNTYIQIHITARAVGSEGKRVFLHGVFLTSSSIS